MDIIDKLIGWFLAILIVFIVFVTAFGVSYDYSYWKRVKSGDLSACSHYTSRSMPYECMKNLLNK